MLQTRARTLMMTLFVLPSLLHRNKILDFYYFQSTSPSLCYALSYRPVYALRKLLPRPQAESIQASEFQQFFFFRNNMQMFVHFCPLLILTQRIDPGFSFRSFFRSFVLSFSLPLFLSFFLLLFLPPRLRLDGLDPAVARHNAE
jgi:hypothetical protein